MSTPTLKRLSDTLNYLADVRQCLQNTADSTYGKAAENYELITADKYWWSQYHEMYRSVFPKKFKPAELAYYRRERNAMKGWQGKQHSDEAESILLAMNEMLKDVQEQLLRVDGAEAKRLWVGAKGLRYAILTGLGSPEWLMAEVSFLVGQDTYEAFNAFRGTAC